jgi:hypothetical protein
LIKSARVHCIERVVIAAINRAGLWLEVRRGRGCRKTNVLSRAVNSRVLLIMLMILLIRMVHVRCVVVGSGHGCRDRRVVVVAVVVLIGVGCVRVTAVRLPVAAIRNACVRWVVVVVVMAEAEWG